MKTGKIDSLWSNMERITAHKNESAVVPNHIELTALRDLGLGFYDSKEAIFVRRIPAPSPNHPNAPNRTAEKCIEDFSTVINVHGNRHEVLFFAMRRADLIFNSNVMTDLERTQKDATRVVLHEPNINQSAEDFIKQYERMKKKGKDIVAVLDPAMVSLEELRKKAVYYAAQNPTTLLIHSRNPFKYEAQYMQLMQPFMKRPTRVIEVGIWPRYITHGQKKGLTTLPTSILKYGVDAVCHGVSRGGNEKPNILFLNDRAWKYEQRESANLNTQVLNEKRGSHFSRGLSESYGFSRVDGVIVADKRLRQLKLMRPEELEVEIAQSPGLIEIRERFTISR